MASIEHGVEYVTETLKQSSVMITTFIDSRGIRHYNNRMRISETIDMYVAEENT